MSTPTDDELRTIGLPRGAVQDLLKGAEAPKPKGPDRPEFDPRGAEVDEPPVRRGPSRPLGRLDGDRADRGARGGSEPDILATVPPPGGRRAEAGGRPAEVQRPRSPAGPAGGPSRPESPPVSGPGAARDSRREPAQSPALGRSLDDSDLSTNPLPKSSARPGARPAQAAPAQSGPDLGVPFPEETSAAPLRPPVPAAFPDDSGFDTPDGFPGSSDNHRKAHVPPSQPKRTIVPHDHLGPEDKYDQTISVDVLSSPAAGTRSTLQFFHISNGRWMDLGEVGREGRVLGRETFHLWDANPQGLAEEHLRIGFEGDEVYVEPLETLNGVYRRLQPHRREELLPRTRFRIGRHVLEFRLADPPAEVPPLRAPDGEVFQARVLAALGFIDLIGPNARPYLSFPVTKREERGTRIGREGVECDVALIGDVWVSQRHARIFLGDGKWWIEDLESTNGTYLIIGDRAPLRRGTTRQPGSGDEILVGGYKIRVIEEKA
jgi:pSer/pThr/pTyr-binding forkhead associated (FHA) protein